jgi:hypothetical protein
MPSHQDRRDPLPKGYQFGDAGKSELAAQRMPPLGSRDFWIYWAGFTDGAIEARKVTR